MKNIIFKYILLSLVIILTSCQKEEVVLKQFSDVMYTTSSGITNSALNGFILVNKNSYMTFMDLSQGAISHEWIITNQDGLNFLSSGFSPNAKDSLDRMDHIISDSISSQKTVNIFFKTEGIYTVTLKNSFKDSVSYMTNTAKYDSLTKLWVFTKVFTVKIHGPLIPVVNILKNGIQDISLTTDTIILTVGDSLLYTQSSKGYPTSITWNINGGIPATGSGSTFKTKFSTSGVFNTSLVLSRTSDTWTSTNSYLNYKLPIIKVE